MQVQPDGGEMVATCMPASGPGGHQASVRRMVTGLAIAVVLLGCSSDDEIRDANGTVADRGEISVFELKVGDCLDPDGEVSGPISEITVGPCAEPHTQEVFGVVTHPADVYPGPSEVASFADRGCLTELETSLGLTLDDDVFFSYMLPTLDGWNADGEGEDRQIVCVLVFPNREAVSGSVVAGTLDIERRLPQDPVDEDDEGEPATSDQGGA